MNAGIRLRNPQTGALILDSTYRMGRVLGVHITSSASGAIAALGTLQGALFYRLGLVPVGNPNQYPITNFIGRLSRESVIASGGVLSWSLAWHGDEGLPPGYSYQILYGVY